MKERMLYVCEGCGTEYAEKSKAVRCEENHRRKLKIKDMRFVSYEVNKSGFPASITVVDKDGNEATYKR